MSTFETPLILFTVLAQLSIGLVLVSAVRQFAGPSEEPGKVRTEWFVAGGVLLVGLIASVFHLGHPAGMTRALSHLGKAWLSREALATGLFLALVLVGAFIMKNTGNRPIALLASLLGLVVLLAMGMTYAPPSYPAVNNVLPFTFFAITAVLLGSSVAVLFATEGAQPMLRQICITSLVVGLVVYLIVPCVWLSGGEVMRMTGLAWLGSPLYWARIVVGLVLPLVIVGAMRTTPKWLFVLILAGELMGRAVFFAYTIHASANMGGVY